MTDERYLDVGGVRTRYFDVGTGSPIVLIHGGEPGSTASADTWRHNVEALSARHRVIVPDRLGSGRTGNPASDDGFRIGSISAHLADLLRQVGVSAAAVVGQSRGGFLAAHLAMTAPEIVDRLVIVNSASVAPAYQGYHVPVQQNLRGGPENVRHDAEWYAVVTSHITDEWVARTTEMLSSPLRTETRERMRAFKDTYLADFDREKARLLEWFRSGAFDKPSAVIWGIGDPSTTIADGVDTFELLHVGKGPVRMFVISDCGHSPFAEYPHEFNRILLDFVATPVEELAPSGRKSSHV